MLLVQALVALDSSLGIVDKESNCMNFVVHKNRVIDSFAAVAVDNIVSSFGNSFVGSIDYLSSLYNFEHMNT